MKMRLNDLSERIRRHKILWFVIRVIWALVLLWLLYEALTRRHVGSAPDFVYNQF